MQNINPKSLKKDVSDILSCKKQKAETVLIFKKNLDYIEEFLKKKLPTVDSGNITTRVDLTNFPIKDLISLKDYLDYINMIEE